MVTLREISHLTGFSVSTVSKALNNKFDISPETKAYIKNIATDNNYVPNKNAISLRKSKSNIIAVILPKVNDVVYGEVLSNLQKEIYKLGYRMMLFQSFADVYNENEYINQVKDGSVDAAIVISKKVAAHQNALKKVINIPVAYIQINKNESLAELKKDYMFNLQELLKQIN